MTMPDFWSLLSAPTVDLLGWTLLHFVWQGALVAVLLAGALWGLRRHSPQVRYAVSIAALAGLLALPITTATLLGDPLRSDGADVSTPLRVEAVPFGGAETASPVASSGGELKGAAESWTAWAARPLGPVMPWLVLAWGLGVMACAVRLAGGAWRVRRLRRKSRPAPTEWRTRLSRLADRMGVRGSVALRRSDRIDSPMVSGWWRPVILVPAGLLSGLPPAQVEALLRHELAHVRRHDVLVSHVQAVVETLLFFHPATGWVSGRVRQAREACCDDLAVRDGARRTVYVRALTALAERATGDPSYPWAPAASDASLLGRVRRLLSPEQAPSAPVQRLSMIAATVLVVGLPLGLAACASQQSATEADPKVEADAPAAPSEPPAAEKERVAVLRTDSAGRTLRFEGGDPVEVDSLDGGAYVLRYDGRADTLDVPDPAEIPEIEEMTPPQLPFDPDSLARAIQAGINPDSLARAIRSGIDADRIERIVRMSIDPDSIERRVQAFQLRADSLRLHLDSLRERMRQQMPERLREQARRLREQAERLEERAEEMEAPSPPDDPPSPPESDDSRNGGLED